MSTKQLTAKVRIDASQAHKTIDKLITKINKINEVVNKPSGSGLEKKIERALLQQEKLKQATLKTKLAEEKVTTQKQKSVQAAYKAIDASNKANRSALNASLIEERIATQKQKTALAALRVKEANEKAEQSANKLLASVKKLAKAYLGIQTLKVAITTSDKITSAENRFNSLDNGSESLTADSMEKVYAAAQRARTGYTDMLGNVSKTMTLAGGAFQGNIDNAIRFQEIMAKAYTVGGASHTEASTSMYQLVQALGSGTLAGDELRSVREGAPLAYKAIEKFAQGVLKSDDSLKDMAADGLITSDIVVAAIMDMENGANNINEKFKETKITFAQAWEMIKNMATRAFQPMLQAVNDVLNTETIQTTIVILGQALMVVGNILSWVFDLFDAFFDWCADNWSWLSRVILNVAAIMAVVLFPKFIAWIGYLLFVIQYYIYLGAMALAAGIKAAIAWAIANWQMLLIIAVIVLILTALIWLSDGFADACGIIVGVIMTAVAFIWNVIVGVINAILQYGWTHFIEPWIGIIEWVLNVFNGGFNSFGDAVKNLLGNIISWFLSLGKVVTNIIDAIFGTDWTSGLNSLQEKVLSWGKNENSITLSREAPTLQSISNGKIDRWAYQDAYNTGYEWGQTGGEWLADKASAIGSLLSGSGLPDPSDPSLQLGDAYDPSKALDSIDTNTSDINDKMDLQDDDFEYLRKIAEMEWRKEFTTAEIKVDMTNYNSIDGERDLDGIVDYLSETLRSEMTSIADGVHY